MKEEEEDDNIKRCKIVLLGESNVGKESIISCFIEQNIEEGLLNTGGTFSHKALMFNEFQGQSVNFEILEITAQERYSSLSTIHFKDADAVILVYGI